MTGKTKDRLMTITVWLLTWLFTTALAMASVILGRLMDGTRR